MLKKKIMLGIIFVLLIGFALFVWLMIQMGTTSEINSVADFKTKDYVLGLTIGLVSCAYPFYMAYFKKRNQS